MKITFYSFFDCNFLDLINTKFLELQFGTWTPKRNIYHCLENQISVLFLCACHLRKKIIEKLVVLFLFRNVLSLKVFCFVEKLIKLASKITINKISSQLKIKTPERRQLFCHFYCWLWACNCLLGSWRIKFKLLCCIYL